MVKACPNKAADAKPVNIVATVEEYFFKIVSASLNRNEKKIKLLHEMSPSQITINKKKISSVFLPEIPGWNVFFKRSAMGDLLK